jgi:hypothetical protein
MNFNMATLTEVSGIARKTIKWGFVFLVFLAFLPNILGVIKTFLVRLNPPPPIPPTLRYGKLPKLIFPQAPNYATPEYKLETISGTLPSLPNMSKVYLVGINKSRLLILQRMTDKAKVLGLTRGPEQLNDITYRFLYPNVPIDMVFDVITGALSYRFDWTTDKTIGFVYNVPMGNAAVAEGKGFLGKLGALPEDIANGLTNVTYLIATASAMIPAPSPFEANFVRVDYYRATKDEVLPSGEKVSMKVVTAGADNSPVNVIISGLGGEKRIIQANYYYSQTLGDDYATYSLKPQTCQPGLF